LYRNFVRRADDTITILGDSDIINASFLENVLDQV
jgi:hypothetical protein